MQGSFRAMLVAAVCAACACADQACPRGTAVQAPGGWCLPCAASPPFTCIQQMPDRGYALHADAAGAGSLAHSIAAVHRAASAAAPPLQTHVVMDILLYHDPCVDAYRLCPNSGGTARFVVARECGRVPRSLADCAAATKCEPGGPGDAERFRSADGLCEPCPLFSAALPPGAPAHSLWFNATCTCDAGAQRAGARDACELCMLNSYKSAPGLAACTPCPPRSAAPVGATGGADCGSCPNGTMRFTRLYEAVTTSNIICLPCPRSLAALLGYQASSFVNDGVWARDGDRLADYDGSDAAFLVAYVFDAQVCGPDAAPFDGGQYRRNLPDFVGTWQPLVFPRAPCAAGAQLARPRLAAVDSAYAPCPAGTAGAGGAACECLRFANVSGFSTTSVGVSSIAFTHPGTQLDTYATTGRAAAPERGGEPYVSWQYPFRPPGAAAAPVAYGDHIERPLLGGARVVQCSGEPSSGGIDMLLALWREGALRLPLEDTEAARECRMACRAGFFYDERACKPCAAGSFKAARDARANCADAACACTACPAGSFQPGAGAARCLDCPIGHFCEGGAHVQPCFRAGARPEAGAVCQPATHFLTACAPQQGRRNCELCGAALPPGTAAWAAAGSAHCERECGVGEVWDRAALVCRACAPVPFSLGGWEAGARCVPVCEPGFHRSAPAPAGRDGPQCLACDEHFAVVCGGRTLSSPFFVDRAACVGGANTRCAPCADACASGFQQPGAVDLASTARARCTCECVREQLPFFSHVRDVPTSALLLGLGSAQLHAALRASAAPQYGNASRAPGAYCLRWQRSAAALCAQDGPGRSAYLKFEPAYALPGGVSTPGRPRAWPSVVCAHLEAECGDNAPGKFGSDIFESASGAAAACHCRAGLHGEYDGVDGTLQRCLVCAGLGETSRTGTNASRGCVCGAGWARATPPAGDRRCVPCADVSPASAGFFCPGECSRAQDRAPFFTAADERSGVCTEAGAEPCPPGRDVRALRFASAASDCRVSAGLYLARGAAASAAGQHCEADPAYRLPGLTTWTDDGANCSRVCGAGARPHPAAGGGCRCAADAGFRVAPSGGRCECAPGRFAAGAACALCPADFYCTGGAAAPLPCPTDMASAAGGASLQNCSCFPGYAYVTQAADVDANFCEQCRVEHYCNANCRDTSFVDANGYTGMCKCQNSETPAHFPDASGRGLICRSTGLAVPLVCPRGHVYLFPRVYDSSVFNSARCSRGADRLLTIDSWQPEDQRVAVNLLLTDGASGGFRQYAPRWNAVLAGADALLLAPELQAVLRPLFRDYAVVLVSALQLLCPRGSALVLTQPAEAAPPPPELGPLDGQFRCAALEPPLQVVLRARALPAQKALGGSGFVDPASLPTADELRAPAAHLPWAVAVDCSEHVHGRVTLGDNVSCVACQAKMGQRMRLRVAAQGSWDTERAGFFSEFVFVDAPTQLFWLLRAEDRDAPAFGAAAVVFLQVDAQSAAAAHTRVSVLAQGQADVGARVHVLFVFDFVQAARLAPFYGAVQRIVFALAVPLWRLSSRAPGLLLGGCHAAQPDALHVYVHSLALNRSYHSVVRCARCCPPAPGMMHAFLDLVQGSLHVVAAPAEGEAHVLLTVPLDDWDVEAATDSARATFVHELYPGLPAGAASGAADAAHGVVLQAPAASHVIVALEAHPTRVFPVRAGGAAHAQLFALWQDPGQRRQAQLCLHVAAGVPGAGSAPLVLVDVQAISGEVREQLLREHFRAASMAAEGFELLADGFALLNAWDYAATQLEQALPPTLYLVLACSTAGAADARLFVHVQIDVLGGAVTLAVSVLGAHALSGQTGAPRFALVLAPLRLHAEHRNVVVAASRLVEVHRAGALHTVKVMHVRCVACGDGDGRSWVPGEDRCECGAGSVGVCVPCVDAYACSVERFTFDRSTMLDSVNCSVRPRPGAGRPATYYEVCLRCQQHGGVFCPDGRSFEACPGPARPVARLAGAAGPGGCACAHGAKYAGPGPRAAGASGAYAYSECLAERCAEECAPCGTRELCNAALAPHVRVVACPPHSVRRSSSAAVTRFESNVTQACECEPGFVRTGTALAYETAPSALDPNVHAAEWDAPDEALFRTTRFRLDVSECAPCPAGHFCAQGLARACHEHSVSARGQAACLCLPGFYAWSAAAGCRPCPAGHVCADGTATPCAGVPDRGRRAGHPEAHCPCTAGPALYYDAARAACLPCPAGFYCPPPSPRAQAADAPAANEPVRCPAGSLSAERAAHVSACVCADRGRYMRAPASAPARCEPCAAGTFCAQNAQLPCPPGTDSPAGSAGRGACLCVAAGTVLVGGECVCRAGFRATAAGCLACPYPSSARELGALACGDCRAGFWRTGVLANRFVERFLPADADHPLSVQQRVVASAYFAEHGPALRDPGGAGAPACLLCPPGFVCADGAVALPAAPPGAVASFLALPAGAASSARWLERCPARLDPGAAGPRRGGRALVMLGSCFPSTATWQWSRGARSEQDAVARVLSRMPFPAAVLFNVSQNTTLLSHIVNKRTDGAQTARLYWDTAAGFETHELANGLVALLMSIDVLALMRAGGEEFEGFEEGLHAAVRHEDQGTGAAFAAVLPALWAVRVDRFLREHRQGEAVAVMAGVVRNTVTEYVCVRACALVAAAMLAPAPPRLLFLLAEATLASRELAPSLHAHGTLKYAHTAVCAREGCPAPYSALLLSSYTSDGLTDRHAALGAADSAQLHAEDVLRASLRMTGTVDVTDGVACPARMRTAAVNVQAPLQQRYCEACPGGHFYDAARAACRPCTNSPTCLGEGARGLLLQNCSWGADFRCAPPGRVAPA